MDKLNEVYNKKKTMMRNEFSRMKRQLYVVNKQTDKYIISYLYECMYTYLHNVIVSNKTV